MSVLDPLLHAGEARRFKKIVALATKVNDWEAEIEALSDEELRGKTAEFRQRLEDDEELTLDDILPEAFACVREAAKRTIGQRHFDVQVIGGTVLHKGAIAEMKTGEGKTLVATMPAYLNALPGKGVHVATVNPYLAKRDAEWMGQIYRFLGMTCGLIQPDMSMAERRANYACDITYGTNNEFGFDYLRDNMAMRLQDLTQRSHFFGIVDEVDSILIDEARTPLIISGAADEAARWYRTFARHVKRLRDDEHYEVDEAKKTIAVSEEGIARVEELLGIENLYDQVHTPLVHYLETALKAKELYKRDRDYIVQNGEVLIVDEFTGRTLPGRRWSDGLHQAVEAKEGVPIQQENQTLATITIQNYFRMYEKLAGMTGTAKTQATEFANVYNLEVYEIPTNRPIQRLDEPDAIYKTEDAKWKAVTEDVVQRHNDGQPVLVGTVSIEKSERLAGYLTRRGVPHHILNAKHHEREAFIVAQAGRTGAVTLATNMAGRGVDILLGGNAEYLARAEMAARGWDNDAYLLQQLEPEDREAYEAEYEPLLKEMKDQCAAEHDEVVEIGGLYICGTERHESRRIDNQLRGRAGRQGDPGETRFYLSLDDDLMRFFATGMISTVMERLNLPEEMPIESKMVSKAIERAQSQVESQNYEIRKNVLKYDEVMNKQREVVYEQRRQLLEGADLSEKAQEFVAGTIENTIAIYANPESHSEDWDWEGLEAAMPQLFPTKLVGTFDHEGVAYPELVDAYLEEGMAHYQQREEEIGEEKMRELERLVFVSILDNKWREHLYEMDYLREGIGLRGYGQRDPEIEYKREGFDMFQTMMASIKEEFVRYMFHVQVIEEQPPAEAPPPPQQQARGPKQQPKGGGRPMSVAEVAAARAAQQAANGATGATGANGATPAATANGNGSAPSAPVPATVGAEAGTEVSAGASSALAEAAAGEARAPAGASPEGGGDAYPGTPRNAACPCGSGRKYKKCHGAAA
ncbi:MAG TPA: preprotein translocase subunit SecA [Actinomycetota bacterium]|nr:preprotein translocase subunit SecA [Actinomycetota bacterium]